MPQKDIIVLTIKLPEQDRGLAVVVDEAFVGHPIKSVLAYAAGEPQPRLYQKPREIAFEEKGVVDVLRKFLRTPYSIRVYSGNNGDRGVELHPNDAFKKELLKIEDVPIADDRGTRVQTVPVLGAQVQLYRPTQKPL